MWTEFLRDLKPIKGVFGEALPELEGRLHEVILHQDGPALKLRLDLKAFPKELPKKWTEKSFNTAQITVLVGEISDLAIKGWTTNNDVVVEVTGTTGDLSLTVHAANMKLTCKAKSIAVLELTGYRKR